VYAQWLVADPAGPALGGTATVTRAAALRFGTP
jgi:hypothetical protein